MLRRLPPKALWALVLASALALAGLLFATSPNRDGASPTPGQTRGAGIESRAVEATPEVAASSRPHPLSCKPSPPVVVTLVAGSTSGVWRVRIEALADAAEVEVTMGGRTAAADLSPVTVWRGALAQGESRDLEVRYAPPGGTGEVWVDAAAGAANAMQRSRAALAVRDGRAVPHPASEVPPGRTVTDPMSGHEVVEFDGAAGGTR